MRVTEKQLEIKVKNINSILEPRGKGVVLGYRNGYTAVDLIDLENHAKTGGVIRNLAIGNKPTIAAALDLAGDLLML